MDYHHFPNIKWLYMVIYLWDFVGILYVQTNPYGDSLWVLQKTSPVNVHSLKRAQSSEQPCVAPTSSAQIFWGLKTINVFGRCIIVNHCLFTLGMENKIWNRKVVEVGWGGIAWTNDRLPMKPWHQTAIWYLPSYELLARFHRKCPQHNKPHCASDG
jgi:hypothetical protein